MRTRTLTALILLISALSPAEAQFNLRRGIFRLLLDEPLGNGPLANPAAAPEGGDQPIYLPGYRVADPAVQTAQVLRVVKSFDRLGRPTGSHVEPQRLTLIAHAQGFVGATVDFHIGAPDDEPASWTSEFEGVCTNHSPTRPSPDSGELPSLDFTFPDNRFVVSGVPVAADGTARTTLLCWDFAAHTTVFAILHTAEGDTLATALEIPLTTSGGGPGQFEVIADHWKARHGFTPTGIRADDDLARYRNSVTGQIGLIGERVGDGFDVFEKYRGFLTMGAHQRLDPRVKNVFVLDATDDPSRGIYTRRTADGRDAISCSLGTSPGISSCCCST